MKASQIQYSHYMKVPSFDKGDVTRFILDPGQLKRWQDTIISKWGDIELDYHEQWGWQASDQDCPFRKWQLRYIESKSKILASWAN